MSDWYLRKPDGSNYGPVSTDDLRRWAAECRIAPGNEVSSDQETWIQVEDLSDLQMDWMATRPDGKEYGPFNIAAAKDLHDHGVLPDDAELTNRISGQTCLLSAVLNEEDAVLGMAPESAPSTQEAPPKKPDRTRKRKKKTESQSASEEGKPELNKSSLVQLEDRFKEHKKATAGRIKLLTEERDTLSAQLEALQASSDAEAKKANARNTALKVNLAEIEAEVANSRQELARLRTKLKQVDAVRAKAENDAVEGAADVRKQVAFMKKNNATLRADLDTAKAKASRSTRAFFLLVLANVLVAVIVSLIRRNDSSSEPREAARADGPLHAAELQREEIKPRKTPDGGKEEATKGMDRAAPAVRPWPAIRVDGVRITAEADSFTMVFDRGFFASMAKPSRWGRDRLEAIAEQIGPHISYFRLHIEGHTDNQPIRKSKQYRNNEALALDRAQVVAEILATEYGFPTDSMRATSVGNAAPPYPNNTSANRKRNRTVVLKLSRAR